MFARKRAPTRKGAAPHGARKPCCGYRARALPEKPAARPWRHTAWCMICMSAPVRDDCRPCRWLAAGTATRASGGPCGNALVREAGWPARRKASRPRSLPQKQGVKHRDQGRSHKSHVHGRLIKTVGSDRNRRCSLWDPGCDECGQARPLISSQSSFKTRVTY